MAFSNTVYHKALINKGHEKIGRGDENEFTVP